MFGMFFAISSWLFATALILISIVSPDNASAASFEILYKFNNDSGEFPFAGLSADKAGNLYGTTVESGRDGRGAGTVFKLAPDRTFTVLHLFKKRSGGTELDTGVIADESGNIFGATTTGGDAVCGDGSGCGVVFKLVPNGEETVLFAFKSVSTGTAPEAGLIEDKEGNLYGTTEAGGVVCKGVNFTCGTVFKVTPDGKETVLYAFPSPSDGMSPYAAVVEDASGNLYGTTELGGGGGGTNCYSAGCGVVFKLTPDGTETVLHAFADGNDGAEPVASLIEDNAGNLFGTTAYGGGGGCNGTGCGTIFEVAPDGTETILYAFAGGSDGAVPCAGLIEDGAGNLFGTTYGGGSTGWGTAFELAPDGTETILHTFTGGNDGGHPRSALIADQNGNLYGTTEQGGRGCKRSGGCGTVFEIKE